MTEKLRHHSWAFVRYKGTGRAMRMGDTESGTGDKILLTEFGYIGVGLNWSTWECGCSLCDRDWEVLLRQIKGGALKEWPEEFKFIPEKYRAEFTRAFLEGKIRQGG